METFEHLLVFLAFVRTAHFWTKLHPELKLEDDIKELLAIHESLAGCVQDDPEAASSETTQRLLDELAALRREQAEVALRERSEQLKRLAEVRARNFIRGLTGSAISTPSIVKL